MAQLAIDASERRLEYVLYPWVDPTDRVVEFIQLNALWV
jgi:hypothetical protein